MFSLGKLPSLVAVILKGEIGLQMKFPTSQLSVLRRNWAFISKDSSFTIVKVGMHSRKPSLSEVDFVLSSDI